MRTTNLIAAWALLTFVHAANGAETLPPCDPMPAAQLTTIETRPYRSDALYLAGDIVVSVTIAANGAIKDAQRESTKAPRFASIALDTPFD